MIVASCGIGAWHVGRAADARMSKSAAARGLILDTRAKQFVHSFYEDFDWILAVDEEIIDSLGRYAAHDKHRSKLHLITRFSKKYPNQPIPDPYHGGDEGFEEVLDMLEDSCLGLLEHLYKKL